jgi:hypothetical protein
MTLVIAHRLEKKVTFCSDSRISFGAHGYFDKGIKIFTVPFRLKGPAKTLDDFNRFEFEHDYGMAVVGSSVNAYAVKDTIAELLPYTTYLTNMSDVSIPSLGNIILKVYKAISQEVVAVMGQGGLCEIIFGGFCLHQKRVRVLRFYFTVLPTGIEYHVEEILKQEEMLFFGSGKLIAEEIYDKDNTLQPLQVLKYVVLSQQDSKVGGPLQVGAFYAEDFKISGVMEKEVDASGATLHSEQYRRGLKVENEIRDFTRPPYLAFSYGYVPVEFEKYKFTEK